MPTTADPAQVRALTAAYVRHRDDHQALALHAEPQWSAPPATVIDGRSVRVVPCAAPLAVREILAEDRPADELLVILTPCTGGQLGLDVRARLVRRDVLPLDPFATVLALFGATALDPGLLGERWLIDDLIRVSPADGWRERPPASGVLDADTAWAVWHQVRLGVTGEPTDLPALLALGERSEPGPALAALPAGHRDRLGRRWAATLGAAAPVIADLVAEGSGRHLTALGLLAGVLWGPTDRTDLADLQTLGRARLEDRFGRDRLHRAAAEAWAVAARRAYAASARAGEILDTAAAELRRADVTGLTVLSDQLPAGFDLRLGVLAASLARADVRDAEAALAHTQAHELAAKRPERMTPAAAAVRLLRRHPAPPSPATGGFAGQTAAYQADGSFVDEAVRLLEDGDALPALTAAYADLVGSVRDERVRADAGFVAELARWSAAEPVPDRRLVPLERVLADVVAPTARAAPVLVVVCDGMGLAVAHELLRDLRDEHWVPAAPSGQDAWPTGVALLPTVTDVSRTSLLTGTRNVGGQADERAGFAAHPDLLAASTPAHPPVLLHKGALQAPSGQALPADVQALIADPDQRVVGVVVNAVDDHLARGDQVRVGWGRSALRPLGWLLDAADDAGRLVVLTADHGHVLHPDDAVLRPAADGGERWRPAPPPAADGEIDVRGPRVLRGGGHVVLPADDRIRYGGHKHGYHGGATPREVLVPVEVLARHLPDGWHHLPDAEPPWWTGIEVPAPTLSEAPPAASLPRTPTAQGSLFDPAPAPTPTAAGGWVDRLLASPAFGAHRSRVRLPRPLPDERLRRFLDPLAAGGGSIPLATLAATTGEPADSLRLALGQVQRLLNVDGTEILAVRDEDGTVHLDRHLAALQFELPPP